MIVRLSDFKSNEYANLIGGERYEPDEENPMLGFRGASRYVDETFRPCFELECRALRRVREEMGLTNVQVMVPFVRTVQEAHSGRAAAGRQRPEARHERSKVIMMCELPTNALLAEEYLEHFDGMSIGSNDMTQLTLGLDRDSAIVAKAFDERDPAVKTPAGDGHCGLPQARQIRRHLRSGTLRPSRPGTLARRAGYREHVAQSGYGGRNLAVSGPRQPAGTASEVRTASRGQSRRASWAARGRGRRVHRSSDSRDRSRTLASEASRSLSSNGCTVTLSIVARSRQRTLTL